jgi:hypothetical protein
MPIFNDTKIRIIFDPENIYSNRVMEVKDLIDDYLETVDDDTFTFIVNSATETALNFIINAWGLQYELC